MNKTDSAKYLGEAQELAAKVAMRVDEIDEERQIPTDLFRDMADAGFFKLLVPESLGCLLYTSPSPRDLSTSRMPSSA